jgi:DnaK suppressor protein
MDKEQLAFFRNMLVELHENTLARIQHVKELMRQPHDCSDESDLASWQEQANISLLIIAREQKLLPKIKEALERIRTGSYGYCQESGEAIGIPRLLARPTAEYGSDIKGIKEMKEDHFNAS